MPHKYNNTVILSQGGEHGKRVIQWWKEQGVDVGDNHGHAAGLYYGLFNGKFGCFGYLQDVKIIELPESNPQDLIGRKVRGFTFNTDYYVDKMDDYLGEVGVIIQNDGVVCIVEFDDDETWAYPTSLIHEHLVEEGTNNNTPKIIDLSNVEGVEMMVSFNEIDWCKSKIVAKMNSVFIDHNGGRWNYAKPIEVKKVTMEDIEEMFGCRVEIVKEG